MISVTQQVLKKTRETNVMNETEVNALCQQAEALWQDTAHGESKEKSIALFKEAFQLGERVKSAYRLGVGYLYGRGVKKDLNMAHEYLMVPELDGIRFAQYYRGILFSDPEFLGQDNRKALKALQRALNAGVDVAAAAMQDVLSRAKCPICYAVPAFDEHENDQACPQCHALNVHRAFAHAYHKNVRYLFLQNHKLGKMEYPSSNGVVASNVKITCSDQDVPTLEFFANTVQAQENFDFIIACCESGNIKNTLHKYLNQPLNHGLLALLVSECRLSSKEERSLRRKEYVSEFVDRGFQVHVFDSVDPFYQTPFTIYVATHQNWQGALQRRADNINYVDRIVAANAQNELDFGEKVSKAYERFKQENPGASYASFAVTKEAASVSENRPHATLGENITEASRQQGVNIYSKYMTILGVQSSDKVIEYGCGSLRVGGCFVETLDRGHYFGLDVVREFYEIGRSRLIKEIGDAKDHHFHLIDEDGIQLGEAFGADHVFASNVLFHIHPDDIRTSLAYIARLCAKPGCRLIFDAKITRDDNPRRYSQRHEKGGWAWPLDFYRAALFPLDLIAVHDRMPYHWYPEVDVAHIEFQMPYGV